MKSVEIYTDGACSCNPGPGGFGIVFLYGNTRKEFSSGYKLTTNNRMELLAVITALEMLNEPCIVSLYSDSKYVIDSVEKRWVFNWQKNNWVKPKNQKVPNADLWQALLKLLAVHKVNFIWVKGHNDNVENERCDKLARDAINSKNSLKIDNRYVN